MTAATLHDALAAARGLALSLPAEAVALADVVGRVRRPWTAGPFALPTCRGS
jgi:hypothetical protein